MISNAPVPENQENLVAITATIVRAYVANNRVPAATLLDAIRSIHATLAGLASGTGGELSSVQKPAVPIRKSITPDYIICLEDGKKLKMLKRYLNTNFQMSPEQYRAKWHLPVDYPMVAPNYAAVRSEFAKKSGLGRKPLKPKPRKR